MNAKDMQKCIWTVRRAVHTLPAMSKLIAALVALTVALAVPAAASAAPPTGYQPGDDCYFEHSFKAYDGFGGYGYESTYERGSVTSWDDGGDGWACVVIGGTGLVLTDVNGDPLVSTDDAEWAHS